MAKYPSLIKKTEIFQAKKETKCSFNKRHVMKKGDIYLLIKSPTITTPFSREKKYCNQCAAHILSDAEENLRILVAAKIDLKGGS